MVGGVFLPVSCPLCGDPGPAPCPRCVAGLRPAPPLAPPPGVDRCLALVAYEGAGADLVAGIKYHNRREALPGFGRALAALAGGVGGGRAATVTWIPTTTRRRRLRGFDHAQLLARHVSAELGVPCQPTLVRGAGPAQTGATRHERLTGPRLWGVRGLRGLVLAVDDVVTTGATASAAAHALRASGADEVWILAAARTRAQGHYGG